MPESPEVDALAGFLRARIAGRRIASTDLEEFRALTTRDRPLGELVGRVATGVRRFGKHVSLDTDGPSLLVGFGRAGWAAWSDGPEAVVGDGAPVIARLGFEDEAELAITDRGEWLSLRLSVVDDVAAVAAIAKLGPDPVSAEFTRDALDRLVSGRRKQLKTLLQEQESLAGIGNAYSDEILHAARLSPLAHASTLDDDERDRFFSAIREVLAEAFAARRDVPIDRQKAEKVASMRVHGRSGKKCSVCGDTVLDIPGSKGAAQYCPTCQTGGVSLSS
jgi:formamidopyrimidine-DNA glycosylase